MKDFLDITFKDIDCFLIEEENSFFIKAKDEEDTKKVFKYLSDTDFSIEFKRSGKRRVYAHIKYIKSGPNKSFELIPTFIVEYLDGYSVSEMRIIGESIDYFFNPASFFYSQSELSRKENNLLYDKKIVAKWELEFERKQIAVELSYGDILRKGIASDLRLHPCLTVKFGETRDMEYVYRVFLVITRFLKSIQYSASIGRLDVELLVEKDTGVSCIGNLADYELKTETFYPSNCNADYEYLKKYIENILKLVAKDVNYTFFHYPKEGVRFRGMHYSAGDFLDIYAAFERECSLEKMEYELVDATTYDNVRDELCKSIKTIDNTELSEDERWFCEQTLEYVKGLGKKRGQVSKLENAYCVLHGAIDGSLSNIFYMPEYRIEEHIEHEEIKSLAKYLTKLRGKISHGDRKIVFSDIDVTKIHFLEILTYCQFLKRATLSDSAIERIIGVIFGCNYIMLSERMTGIAYGERGATCR